MLKRFPTNIRDIERALSEITSRTDTIPLRLPTQATNMGPGGEASLLQMITSWAFRQERPIVHTYASGPADPQLETLVRRQYGVAAAVVCAAAKAKAPATDVTHALKSAAFVRLEAANSDVFETTRSYQNGVVVAQEREARGRAAELMCIDHAEIKQKVPFYVHDPSGYRTLRDLKGFTQLTNRVFERLVPNYYRRDFGSEFKNAIGAFAHELIGNTHDHARTDLNGRDLEISLRGLYARYYELPGDQLIRTAGDFEPMEGYFRQLAAAAADRVQMIEMSVYDCGPGMAQRWTGSDLSNLSNDQELTAVRDCFHEGASTKHHRTFGGGLPLVISLLAQHGGFLRLRTGRLSLFWRAPVGESQEEFNLSKWLPAGIEQLSPVSGTLVTLLAPLPKAAG